MFGSGYMDAKIMWIDQNPLEYKSFISLYNVTISVHWEPIKPRFLQMDTCNFDSGTSPRQTNLWFHRRKDTKL